MQQGSRRRIGNGEDTEVWKVPWLPCVSNGCITTHMPDQLRETRVVNFLDEARVSWDEEVPRDIFNE